MSVRKINLDKLPEMTEDGHPLFLTDDEDDHPVVSQIQITRMENGQQVYAPRMRQAVELQSLDQIAGEFGGGVYVLIARHAGRIVGSRKYTIPGAPKKMYDETEETAKAKEPPPITMPAPVSAFGGDSSIMALLMTMMQGMMQSQTQAAQNQTQMFIAMMSGNQQASAEEKAAQRAELQANIERERINSQQTMTLMREFMGNKGGGSGEDFTRGVEFMRSFATQQIEVLRSNAKGEGDTDWGSLLETLGQVMQGAGLLKGLVNGAGPVVEPTGPVAEVVP